MKNVIEIKDLEKKYNNFKLNINKLTISKGEIIGAFLGVMILISFMFPLLYKYGTEKGRIISVLLFCIAFFGVILLKYVYVFFENHIDLTIFVSNLGKYSFILFSIITAVLLFVSYKISTKVYLKKEF